MSWTRNQQVRFVFIMIKGDVMEFSNYYLGIFLNYEREIILKTYKQTSFVHCPISLR